MQLGLIGFGFALLFLLSLFSSTAVLTVSLTWNEAYGKGTLYLPFSLFWALRFYLGF
jgi:hypothetical protein